MYKIIIKVLLLFIILYIDTNIIENIVSSFGQVIFYYRYILASYGICNNEITQDTWIYLSNLRTVYIYYYCYLYLFTIYRLKNYNQN